MNKTTQVWNRALDDYGLASSASGDHALAAMLLAHGLVMSGGVLDAVEIMDESQLAAAISGYRFFGFDQVAALLLRTKEILDAGTDDPKEMERFAVGPVEIVLLETDEHLGDLEPQLDLEYQGYIPDDSALFERFERHLAAHPGDFAGL
jgi:hypothetical protein